MSLTRQPLESSNLESAGYDPETRVLEVQFKNGKVYRLRGVEQRRWEGLQAAKSKGEYYNTYLKDKYPASWIAREPVASKEVVAKALAANEMPIAEESPFITAAQINARAATAGVVALRKAEKLPCFECECPGCGLKFQTAIRKKEFHCDCGVNFTAKTTDADDRARESMFWDD